MKTCSRCQLELSEDLFYASNRWTCIGCVKARASLRYKADPEARKAEMKAYAATHPEQITAIKQAWRDRNNTAVVEYARYRRAIFPAAVAEAQEKYRKANMDVYRAAAAKRRASLLKATPAWANFSVINLYYEFAELLTEVTGIEHEVDHVVPLQGKSVSGLHIETNLCVITKHDNRVKSNSFEEVENG